MYYYGYLSNTDSTYNASFIGHTDYLGTFYAIDSTHYAPMAGYVVSDSRTLPGDSTFLQGAFLSTGDVTLTLQDWTYFGGHQQPDTTWVDGTWMYRWFQPTYLQYSVWNKSYDTSQWSLVGYKYRDAISTDTGSYYAPMVVPNVPGHYQARWIYIKDESSYAREVVQNFTSVSRGLDVMPDYPYGAGAYPYPYSDFSGPPSPSVTTIPVYEYKNIGDTAVFTLQYNGAIPYPISYKWYINNLAIADGTKFSGTTTDTLTIYNLTMAEAGFFNCLVSGKIPSTLSYLILDPP